jgi:hypothetical protein
MQDTPLCSLEVQYEATGIVPKPPDVSLMSVPIVIIMKLLWGCLARCHNCAPLKVMDRGSVVRIPWLGEHDHSSGEPEKGARGMSRRTPLSLPTQRRSTPIATTALPFIVRIGPEVALEMRIAG